MNKGIIKLGEKVMVSDPCYGLGTWCQGIIENVLPGNYHCMVKYSDEGDWGIRVAAIEVIHQDARVIRYEAQDFEVGVDSGQAGIFDYEYYAKYHTSSEDRDHVDDGWYDMVCNKTSEYISNPDYTLFVDTPEYKAGILAYRIELDELVKKYPGIDVEAAYVELINHYNDLSNKDRKLDLSSLIDTLEEITKLLEDKADAGEILEKSKEALKQQEREMELNNIKYKHERLMSELYHIYMRSITSQEKLYRNTGNTIDGLGFVSSSGYGDGGYTCWTAKNKEGKVIAIQVEFITDEEEEE